MPPVIALLTVQQYTASSYMVDSRVIKKICTAINSIHNTRVWAPCFMSHGLPRLEGSEMYMNYDLTLASRALISSRSSSSSSAPSATACRCKRNKWKEKCYYNQSHGIHDENKLEQPHQWPETKHTIECINYLNWFPVSTLNIQQSVRSLFPKVHFPSNSFLKVIQCSPTCKQS